MADNKKQDISILRMRHRGRTSQLWIYFGKFLRIFIYQNDWKVLPMAAVIAGMVSIVIGGKFNVTMEGTLMGALALACVSIWNGCFNSIQVICRERAIVKREHRSGMHVSAYVGAHMLFQAIICLMQTGITLYVCSVAGVKLGGEGLFNQYMIVDIGITIFLITYASDMVSLFLSAIVHTPMAAMTVMPFVLIFQLVFSGGFFTLPESLSIISKFTISHNGLQCIAAQGHYNDLPLATGWDTLYKMRDIEVSKDVTADQALGFLLNSDSDLVKEYLDRPATREMLLAQQGLALGERRLTGEADDTQLFLEGMSLYQEGLNLLQSGADPADAGEALVTVRELLEAYRNDPQFEEARQKSTHVQFKIGDVIDLIGKDRLKAVVTERGSEAAWKEDYELSRDNVLDCWLNLILFAIVFAALSVIALEFIDKDKR